MALCIHVCAYMCVNVHVCMFKYNSKIKISERRPIYYLFASAIRMVDRI